MHALIRAAIQRSRATLLALVFLVLGGWGAYLTIPKEAFPDITIPFVYISMGLEGISPEDAERLLVRPMEQELRSLEGIKKMTGMASEGHASVLLEFDAGFNPDRALQNVREKVDTARSKLPSEADEPRVHEINTALFPILSIGLSGPLDEATLVGIGRRLKEELEAIPAVLEVDIGGDREDLLEILVDPQAMESYGLDYGQLFSLVSRNNRLVAAGSLDTGAGRMAMKVPGVIETLDDLIHMPIKVEGSQVVTFGDLASIHRTFKDPAGFARINGQPALVLEITKRTGANIIETVTHIKALLDAALPLLPEGLEIDYIMDQSIEVEDTLKDLLNNVATAVALVMLVVIAAMGLRSALLVGITIPGAFLVGILLIWSLGYTLNMMVLFSLILVAGMLVDGALVVTELADRYLEEGLQPSEAWRQAASRMAWPITASTATTLSVFAPLLFWPGMVGEFMKFLPITVILCLLASLAMALIFLPSLGSVAGGGKQSTPDVTAAQPQGENIDFHAGQNNSSRFGQAYRQLLNNLLQRPGWTLAGMLALILLIYLAYGRFNHGVDFFPDVEPESAQVQIRARGDLSVHERDALVRRVEQRLLGMPEIKALYARSFAGQAGGGLWGSMPEDTIGVVQFQFIDWHQRRPARQIMQDMRERTADLAGVYLEFRQQEQGPGGGKPVVLEISSSSTLMAEQALEQLLEQMQQLGGFTDFQDDRNLPGIEWRFLVDREAAARYGADVSAVGNAVQLVTTGLMLASYRPEDATDEVDIRVRLPMQARTLDQLERMTLQTSVGLIPLSNFVRLEPAPKTGTLRRLNGQRTLTLQADLEAGYQLDERLSVLRPYFADLPEGVTVRVGGEDADMQEAAQFLVAAFFVAIFLMLLILVLQFNSLYQTLLVMSAILFSTAGVLLGLMLAGQPFGIVMVGMGIIALAGIVVNNNIVLIDTYNRIRQQGLKAREAALETGCLRLRPVLLTAVTTILGLMPMVVGVNVNLMEPSLGWGAPSTQWWRQLSSAIAGGLAFATLLTLILTPCMLVLGDRLSLTYRRLSREQQQSSV
ncbi:efflux RND transporter permease subunit [Marinospirillum alkaliphilum]|uniref:Multidrug efflux pump n=1 Tax=Marinospirillum alkaliphilum DSM 21637 TaxID=1122209 RepID=A0A1K1V0A7_9GAMM|nr:efflux RND transporter permease subunit [Marinospirillum alkaliphilum]SFX18534.1 multidrug efflux pump [Marinospirillum alkaliphilum DSM 21637]